jgi:hypothetical protein
MTGFARRMRKAGRTFDWIARALGVPRETCVAAMARAGVLYRPRRKRRRIAAGREPEALGGEREILDEAACRWIQGDPYTEHWRMCGQPCVQRSSWCAHHFPRAHREAEGQDDV